MIENKYQYFLRRLDEKYPDCEALNITDVAEFLGLDRRTVIKRLPQIFTHCEYTSKYSLAKALADIM